MSPPPFNDSNPYNVGDDVNPKPPNLNPKTLTLYLSQALEASLTLNPQTLNPYTPKLLVVVIRDPNQGPRFLNQVPTLYYRRFAWCPPSFSRAPLRSLSRPKPWALPRAFAPPLVLPRAGLGA